jgi:hypothetical protein
MNDYIKLALTKRALPRHSVRRVILRIGMACLVAVMVVGCALPLPGELPVQIPGVPSEWSELQGLLGELGIPDLSDLTNVPGLEEFSPLQTPPGAIAFQGPLELALNTGESVPGTDLLFVGAEAGADAAHFEIAGMRAPRRLGDSLDFDGAWPGVSGVTYHVRLRIYQIGNNRARAAGVQRLVIENVAPQRAEVDLEDEGTDEALLRFPHSVTTAAGGTFPGMTLGYAGQEARGAILTGLAEGEYPYRKIGDSVEWAGLLRQNIPVVYHLRVLYYQDANATVGGVVIVSLPRP